MSSAGKSHILLIEDDPSIQNVMQRQLVGAGFEVTTANDGLDGLMKLETIKPDLIICDVIMPHLDGVRFVKAIKSVKETAQIPVIILTSKNDPRTMIEGINVGARFYLTKPVQFDDLVLKIRRAMKKA